MRAIMIAVAGSALAMFLVWGMQPDTHTPRERIANACQHAYGHVSHECERREMVSLEVKSIDEQAAAAHNEASH